MLLNLHVFTDKNDNSGKNANTGDCRIESVPAGTGDITCDFLSFPVSLVAKQLKSRIRLQLWIILQKPPQQSNANPQKSIYSDGHSGRY